jgi:hypothetical protein
MLHQYADHWSHDGAWPLPASGSAVAHLDPSRVTGPGGRREHDPDFESVARNCPRDVAQEDSHLGGFVDSSGKTRLSAGLYHSHARAAPGPIRLQYIVPRPYWMGQLGARVRADGRVGAVVAS